MLAREEEVDVEVKYWLTGVEHFYLFLYLQASSRAATSWTSHGHRVLVQLQLRVLLLVVQLA